MTDITELAQREKFEAWWEREYKHLESSKYTDAVPHIKYGFWMAYQAGGAELVEALEKAQTINAAAEKLVRCKGRYHSELNYRALADLFGVTMPDLPPLDGECRTVAVKLPDYRNTYKGPFADEVEHQVRLALELFSSAAGIKWEQLS
ncbi:hypothetical protein M9Y55_21765 [Klebsiella oxytoca]|nr:hypothetical protein [Klebsiella oxytoca]MCL8292491.1 hypothetical protein [Klebsiella oxytoca]